MLNGQQMRLLQIVMNRKALLRFLLWFLILAHAGNEGQESFPTVLKVGESHADGKSFTLPNAGTDCDESEIPELQT